MTITHKLLLSLVLAGTGHAGAETYTCTAASNRAKVGVARTSEVGVTSDTDKKECRFSINGAVVGSPPQEDVFAGMNAIITGDAVQILEKGEVLPVANLLLSSSTEKSPGPALVNVLKQNSKELARCLDSFKRGVDNVVISKDNIFCGGVKEGSIPVGGGNTVILGDSQGMHVLAVSPSKGVVHFVFFPPNYRGGTVIPTR